MRINASTQGAQMLKKLVGTVMMVPVLAHAAGPIDGIYFCNAAILGQIVGAYITVNGHPDGRTIFAVAAVQPNMPVYGYGIGQVSGNTFFGSTHLGLPFNLAVSGDSVVGTFTSSVPNIGLTPAAISCLKVW
jgi:hypothetical protein